MRTGGLRRLPWKSQQATSSYECVRVKDFFPPCSFPVAFVCLKRMGKRCPGDRLISEIFEWNGCISRGLSSALTGFKPLCQVGWSQHICSQMEDSIFTKASCSENHKKPFSLGFKISCEVGPLRNAVLNITRKEFYRFSKLARVLKLVEKFHINWCDFVIKMAKGPMVLPLHT